MRPVILSSPCMAIRVLARLAILLITALAAAACGGDDDEGATGDYVSSCQQACARIAECDSSQSIETCTATCRSDAGVVGPNLSAQFLTGLDACIQGLTCPELAAAALFDNSACEAEAAARVVPTGAVTSFCDRVSESFAECTGIAVGTGGCIDSFKVFSDAALGSASRCADEPCDQRVACLDAELGLSLSGQAQ